MNSSILIIGGGHMGGALAKRWHAMGYAVTVVEPTAQKRDGLSALGIACVEHRAQAAPADVTVLAVKPQQFNPDDFQLGEGLLVSIMAGVPLARLSKSSPRCARVMPNLPAVVGESMSVVCAPALFPDERQTITQLFDAVGQTAWVENEDDLHSITAISGSGPAYLFAFIEAFEAAATQLGLDAKLAHMLVAQTIQGAAALVASSPLSAAGLREQVTSPGGTTEAALNIFKNKGLATLLAEAAQAAAARSKALAE